MLRVVMYGPDAEENRRVRELLEDLIWSAEIKPVFREFREDREAFCAYVKRNPYLVMLIVQSGPEGAETARLAKEANDQARLVWFSRQDYALYAFELNLTFFGLLPVSREKAVSALNACWYERAYPLRDGPFSLAQPTPFSQR